MTETFDNPATVRYRETCKRLGFDPATNFVRIHTDGSIGFSAGKPDEVRSLLAACRRSGLRPSKALLQAASR